MRVSGKVGGTTPDVADPAYFANAFDTVNGLVNDDLVAAIHDVSAGGTVTALLEMCFANTEGGLNFYTDGFAMYGETDLIKILFAENPAVLIQVRDRNKKAVEAVLDKQGLRYFPVASMANENVLTDRKSVV